MNKQRTASLSPRLSPKEVYFDEPDMKGIDEEDLSQKAKDMHEGHNRIRTSSQVVQLHSKSSKFPPPSSKNE